ncbi:MAG: putative ABC transporter permease, partial [Lachnospiraceae bacterium]|nr:putative ABC transporter permease [Lachnospiraceae bacterium]
AFSFVGWIWEVSIHLVEDGMFVNRGVMHGPWLPIYGSGALMILIVLNRFRKNPWLEFLLAIVLCGVVEYFTSWLLEVNHGGTKWWDYTGYFININGRICAEGLLVFGIGGMAVVYFLGPLLDNVLRRIRGRYIFPLCAILVIAFAIDMIYSHYYPNMGVGITDYGAKKIIDIVGYL